MAWPERRFDASVAQVTKRDDDAKYDAFLADVGQRIARVRKARGLTQEQLAEELRIAARALQKIESGSANLTLRTVARLASALQIEPAALIPARETKAD